MADRRKGYRSTNPVIRTSISFPEYVRGFADHAVNDDVTIKCPHCGGMAHCQKTTVLDNLDVRGSWSCSCGYTFERTVNHVGLRKDFNAMLEAHA